MRFAFEDSKMFKHFSNIFKVSLHIFTVFELENGIAKQQNYQDVDQINFAASN